MRDRRMLLGVVAFGTLVSVTGASSLTHLGPGTRRSVSPSSVDSVFDHTRHQELFPTCDGCHQLIEGGVTRPAPEDCAACHDGTTVRRVDWQPVPPRPTNLRFDHVSKLAAMNAALGFAPGCSDCHAMADTASRGIQRIALPLCMGCHAGGGEHVVDAQCRTCHLALAEEPRLTESRIAGFPKPPSHDDPAWGSRGGHGLLAFQPPGESGQSPIAASCETCHARDFCLQCHVDAPEQPAIQALKPDARSLALEADLQAPESHGDAAWLAMHGTLARSEPRECQTCHTRESCLTCHAVTPDRPAAMHPAGPGRSEGARVTRRPPASHTREFRDGGHGAAAAARTATCESCHARQDCLSCHRPSAADRPTARGFHPPDFLARHPAAAYSRQASCSDCHNTASFCQTCHSGAGLVTNGPLARGFHDTKPLFIAGHGQAARQNLESCVTCHVERDCLTCHSALGGRRFNPHGPGFDAERLRKRSPSLCTTCHGVNIP